MSGNLGCVKRGNAASNGFNAFEFEVNIVNAKLVVEPSDLLINKLLRNPSIGL